MLTDFDFTDNEMPRIPCPQCEKPMTAKNTPSKMKHITQGKETLVTNYALCLHCGARARYTAHVVLIKDISQEDWVSNN